jgi:hypothetical protein
MITETASGNHKNIKSAVDIPGWADYPLGVILPDLFLSLLGLDYNVWNVARLGRHQGEINGAIREQATKNQDKIRILSAHLRS